MSKRVALARTSETRSASAAIASSGEELSRSFWTASVAGAPWAAPAAARAAAAVIRAAGAAARRARRVGPSGTIRPFVGSGTRAVFLSRLPPRSLPGPGPTAPEHRIDRPRRDDPLASPRRPEPVGDPTRSMPKLRPRILRIVLAAALAAVLALLLTACGAEEAGEGGDPVGPAVALQDDFLPIVPLEQIPARLDLIEETGATTTRVDIFWWATAREEPEDPRDPSDPAYDWTRADAILNGLAEREITPIVSVYSTPPWAAGGEAPADPMNPVNTAPPDPEAFADFMVAIATRYNGDFESAEDVRLPQQLHWEIWNEPNLNGFLARPDPDDPQSAMDRYAEMVKAAYPAIKEVNGNAVVIAGVAGPRGTTGRGASGRWTG